MSGFKIEIRGQGSFTASRGSVLLDAGLSAGIDMPHDCRAGVCGSCRVQVVSGAPEGMLDGERSVLACQARVESDLAIEVERVPPVVSIRGRVSSLQRLAQDVFEVGVETESPLGHLPGQYAQVAFAGFPSRCFSPSLPLQGPARPGEVSFHIQRVPGGLVSGALETGIRPGHGVRLRGPFGSAYLRAGGAGRLILLASGTGFAPVWAIAQAALAEMPDRRIWVVASAKSREHFYMGPALLRLAAFPNVRVMAGLRSAGESDHLFFVGDPLEALPDLERDDIAFGCGAPAMVEALAERARLVGAECHADAFSSPPRATPPLRPAMVLASLFRRERLEA